MITKQTDYEKVRQVYPDVVLLDVSDENDPLHGWVIKSSWLGSVLTTSPHLTKEGAWKEVAEWILKTPESPEPKHDTRTAKARLQEMRSSTANTVAVLDSLLELLIEMEGWKA
jgi:hypothetical protein